MARLGSERVPSRGAAAASLARDTIMKTLAVLLLLASSACAQYPFGANALRWEGTNQAGPACWGFSCTPAVANVRAGEIGTLVVRGDLNQAYALALSTAPAQCTSIRGALNQLVVGQPFLVFASGALTQLGTFRACPIGLARLPIQVPAGLPRGTTFLVQGAIALPAVPGAATTVSFTQALRFTVN